MSEIEPDGVGSSGDGMPDYIQWMDIRIFAVSSFLIVVGYVLIGIYAPGLRPYIDFFITPIVEGLKFFYLNVRVCLLTGDMDATYYRNLAGMCIMLSVGYNVASIIYMLRNKQSAALSCELVLKRLMVLNKNIPRSVLWKKQSNVIYIKLGVMTAIMSLNLLNAMFGWVRIQVSSLSVISTLVVCFGMILPSCFCAACWSIILQYIKYDLMCNPRSDSSKYS